MGIQTIDLPARPKRFVFMRPVLVPGVQYGGESIADMERREKRCREIEADFEATRVYVAAWRAKPWWEF